MTVKLKVTQQWWDNGDESPTGWDCAVSSAIVNIDKTKKTVVDFTQSMAWSWRWLWALNTMSSTSTTPLPAVKTPSASLKGSLVLPEEAMGAWLSSKLLSSFYRCSGAEKQACSTWLSLHRGPSDVAHLPSQTFAPQSNLHHGRLHPPWTWTLSAPPPGWSVCSSGAGGPVE